MPQKAKRWTNNKDLDHWSYLFTGPPDVLKWRTNSLDNPTDQVLVNRLIEQYLNHLRDSGWLMKSLSGLMDRQTNKEMNTLVTFWIVVINYKHVEWGKPFIYMAYVGLNPIRASLCNPCETLDHTSIKDHIAPSFDLKKATNEEIKWQRLQSVNWLLKTLAISKQ